jgi:hypothetical protein
MIERLVIFGDSFAYGDGLDNHLEECYAARIAQHFGWELINLGVPGGSNETSKWQLHRFQKQEYANNNNLIMHGLTHPNRTSWIGNEVHGNFYCNLIPVTIGEYKQNISWCNTIQQEWAKHCYSEEWEEYNNWHTVQVFNAFAQQTNQPMLQYYTYDALDNLTGIMENFSMLQNIQWPGKHVFFDHGHLTAEGNQIAADYFIDYISREYSQIL